MREENFHSISAEESISRLGSHLEGLSQEEAASRFKKQGPNELEEQIKIAPAMIFFRQFLNPLVYILAIAATIKFFVKGLLDAIVIVGVLLFMAIISFIQEFRAEKAMRALINMVAPKAKVIRDRKWMLIPAKQIVPGDIIALEAGDKVPADARLLEVANFKVDEASLTGESFPVEKQIEALMENRPMADCKNMIYMGTSVAYGRAKAIVTNTGMGTEIGKIAEAIQNIQPQKTALQKSIDRLGRSLIWVVLFLCLGLGAIGFWRGMDAIELFLLVVAASVAAIPEALPAVVTVVLAVGMQRMAGLHAIIRKLVAVETLGSTTVICSDKTGTLTMNQMTVRKIFLEDQWIDVTGEGYNREGEFHIKDQKGAPENISGLRELVQAASLCNNAILRDDDGMFEVLGDPMEGALLIAALKAKINLKSLHEKWVRIDEIPFESEKQYMATLYQDGDRRIVFLKGSLEKTLSMAKNERIGGEEKNLDDNRKQVWIDAAEKMALDAMRVLAVASLELADSQGNLEENIFSGRLVILGLIGMIDPPRQEAKDAISLCRQGGIKVVMATGDHKNTAEAIGHMLEIPKGLTLTGTEIGQMSEQDLIEKIGHVSIFARIEPLHKLKIVQAFQNLGHIVAMTGDGINDAPALQAADIGVAMGINGTDVAKDASDMVLTDDNFASIVTAVEEGRAIFNRLRNVATFMLTTCFGELLTIALGVFFLGQTPLVPLQILWINLVTGALIAIPLGLEPPTGYELTTPPRSTKVGLIYPGMVLRIAFLSLMLGAGAFFIFLWTIKNFEIHKARTMTFCCIVAFEWLIALNARSDEYTIFRLGIFKNKWVISSIFCGVILQIMVLYVPFFHDPFDTVALTLFNWGIVLIPGVTIFLIETFRKIFFPKLFNLGKMEPVSWIRR